MDDRCQSTPAAALRQIVIAALLALLSVAPLWAAPQGPIFAGGPRSLIHQRPIEERVIDLPEDGDMWHLVVVIDSTKESTELQQSIGQAPRLANLVRQVKPHFWPASHWWPAKYLAGEKLPIVLVCTEQAQVIYKASGTNIPAAAEELADEIESAIWAYKSDCPDCQPSPTRPLSRIPDMRGPDNSGGTTSVDPAMIALVIIAGLAAVAAAMYRKPQSG
jgi:hypothetical protein